MLIVIIDLITNKRDRKHWFCYSDNAFS